MHENAEALAPQPDANVVPDSAQPDGAEQKPANEADPSSAAPVKASENLEPEAKGIQRRFDELTRLRRDAERDRDHWRDLAMREKPQAAPKEPDPQAAKPKTLADFNFDESEHSRYLIAESGKAAAAQARAEFKAEQEREAEQRRVATYVTRVKEFAKDKPDYQQIAESAPISDEVVKVILGLETGPELAYYLGQPANYGIATELSRLPTPLAAYELGQIAANLKYEREKANGAKKLVSGAPPPNPRIEGSEPAITVKASDPASDGLPGDQWLELRNKELRKGRKRSP